MNLLYIAPFAFNFIEWIRDNVLQPFIEIIASIIINNLILQFKIMLAQVAVQFYNTIYVIFVAVLKVIDVLQTVFNTISGVEKVYYTLGGESGTEYLSTILLRVPQIKTVFWSIWLLSIVLCIVFLIAAIVRSIANLDDTGQSVGDILRQTAGTILLFATVQVVAYCTVSLSNVLLTASQKAMDYAMGTTEDMRISNSLFAASAMRAGRTGDPLKDTIVGSMINGYISNDDEKYVANWELVEDFYTGKLKYYDIIQVNLKLVVWKIDYLSAALCIICILKYMVGASLALVSRVVSIVVAYVTAPFFVSVAPLDGGARFERWKNYFVGTCFGAIGTVFSIKIYMLLMPIFLKNDIIYVGDSAILSYLTRVYSVAVISLGFEKLGDVVNKIISDSGAMGPTEAFAIITNFVDNVESVAGLFSGGKGGGKGGGGKGGGGKGGGKGG